MTETNGYPLQNAVKRDSFIFISAVNENLGEPDTGDQTDFILTNDANINAADALLEDFLPQLQFGHAFCGSIRIEGNDAITLDAIKIRAGDDVLTRKDGTNILGVQCLFLANTDPC